MPEGTLDSLLLEENVDALTGILTYHVVAANALSSSLTSGDIETLNGATVAVTVDDGVSVNDSTVVIADIITSNGIIHVIDAVLLPPSDDAEPEESAEPEEVAEESAMEDSDPPSIYEVAATNDAFSTLGKSITFHAFLHVFYRVDAHLLFSRCCRCCRSG